MRSIKVLPESVRNSLRSGIILSDLTRVVEELVFNSLDSGATKVIVAVGVGTNYIKVTDNGCGITRDGLVLLGERYATSKFEQVAGMKNVPETFGFRGEALSSISDVSLLQVVTKAHGMPNGYCKVIKCSKCLYLGIDDDRQDVGTTVVVRDLFYNQPVKRRHLQSSPKKVLHSVKECILRIALVHLQTCFKLIDTESGDELLSLYPSSSPLPLLVTSFGTEVSTSLHKLDAIDDKLKLSGFISSPCETFSVKAFQYFYINSRYISKGPIHKLLNQLATDSDLFKSEVRSECGKRARCQACLTYILNLSCPRAYYDLSFEPTKTCAEFKDWDPVFTFIKKAVSCFWSKDAHISKKDDLWDGADTLSSKDDSGHAKKRRKSQYPQTSIILSSPQLEIMPKDAPKHLISYNKYSCKGKAVQSDEMEFDYHLPDNFLKFSPDWKDSIPETSSKQPTICISYQDIYSKTKKSKHISDVKWNPNNKLLVKEPLTIPFSFDDEEENTPFLRSCSSHSHSHSHMDLSPVIRSKSKQLDHAKWNLDNNPFHFDDDDDDVMKPFIRSCSSHMEISLSPVIRSKRGDDEKFRFQDDGFKKWLHFDDDRESNDNDIQGSKSCLDENASVWSPPRILGTESPFLSKRSFDSLLTDRDCFKENTSPWASPLSSNQRSRLSHEYSKLYWSPITFLEKDEHQMEDVSERDFKLHRDKWFDLFADEEKEKDIFDFQDTIRYSSFQQGHFRNSQKSPQQFDFLYDKQHESCIHRKTKITQSKQRRRSHSAPPFYKGKKKFVALNSQTPSEPIKSHNQTFHNAPLQEASNLKYVQKSPGVHHLLLKGPTNDSRHNKKKLIDKGEISDHNGKPTHCLDVYNIDSDFTLMENEGALDFVGKWRDGCLNNPSIEKKTDDVIYEDNILDISSGILHLSGDSLTPKSITRKCLEHSRVLHQVDKKFIPIVGDGILAIIDQHAADERIRLEDLRKKVLAGKMKTVCYLDAEQELVLPEIGYQLLNNYSEQIQKWGWICNFHANTSVSFKKSLNFLHNQPSVTTLIAVPCILGVNLTDVDLLEFLKQLSDTDGSSLIPPAVVRLLNSKACRGAIMFGDALLPSECSLIVEELKHTSLCFQCAHGRPTTVPLVDLLLLHKQIAKLGKWNHGPRGPWHGLTRHKPTLDRASQRLGQC